VKKSLKLLAAAAGLMAISATASAFSTAPCKACHAIDHDVVGPAWQLDVKEYGSADALAAVFKSGFKVEDRKVLNSDPAKWKAKAAIMTPQFNTLIKGHEDEAAKALFDAVKAGKM
jgi:cytochrome c551/c552